jgi:hypothetical protein
VKPGYEISITDVAVGDRIWMDTHHAVFKRGYITYHDHIVTKISYYNHGGIHAFTLHRFDGVGLEEHVEARRVILIRKYTLTGNR